MKKMVFLALAIALVAIIAAGIILIWGYYGDDPLKPDLNMSELTTEQIVEIASSQSSYFTSWTCKGEGSGMENEKYAEADYNATFFSAKKINGIKTVSATLAKDCNLNIIIDSELSKGDARIVIVMDDTIIEDFAAGEERNFEYIVEGEHEFYVKILCQDAEIEIRTIRELK